MFVKIIEKHVIQSFVLSLCLPIHPNHMLCMPCVFQQVPVLSLEGKDIQEPQTVKLTSTSVLDGKLWLEMRDPIIIVGLKSLFKEVAKEFRPSSPI